MSKFQFFTYSLFSLGLLAYGIISLITREGKILPLFITASMVICIVILIRDFRPGKQRAGK